MAERVRQQDTVSGTTPAAPRSCCSVCSSLADKEYAYSKYGWPEHDISLPAAAGALIVVKDFKPLSDRKRQLRRCPECDAWFLYESDYEYLTNGTEEEEFLTRLTENDVEKMLGF